MAKYQITYGCGHEDVVQLYGKNVERERKLNWMQRNLCPECYKAQQEANRQAENTKAAEAAEEKGRQELTGSEKQVAWATTIREEIMTLIEKAVRKDTENGMKVHEYLNSQTSAKYWIDNRDAKLNLKGFIINTAKEIGLS